MNNTVEIRLELLKKQGEGYSKAETVKHLSETFGITRSGAYYHFETLGKWSSQYLDFDNVKDFQFNIMNQLNTINREASFQYLQAKDDNSRIGYMRVRLEALSKLKEFLPEGAKDDKPDGYRIEWKDQMVLDRDSMTKEEHEAVTKADAIIRAHMIKNNDRRPIH